MPWVRLHGVKDYLDMVKILEKFPQIRQTFNLVPSLVEQIEDYNNQAVKDKFLELSLKPAQNLTPQDKTFILKNFFSIFKDKAIAIHPRFYDLYFMRERKTDFTTQDFLDLQVWFNLAWIDQMFRESYPELKNLVIKARFYTEEEKLIVLNKQSEILKEIIPAYKKFMQANQIEISVSPYYHPILPLLFNTNIAKEGYPKTILPKIKFAYPQDALAQIDKALNFYADRFETQASGMWPSEEAVSEHILPLLIQSGINWIVADEGILFKSFKKKRRDTELLYQPHVLNRKEGVLNIVFRDRNLSDLLGFVYHGWRTQDAVNNFMGHLENISLAFNGKDALVTVAMDGENAWEYYSHDGHDFLELLYERLSESKFVKTTTIKDYLAMHPPKSEIKRLAAGSWIYAQFGKWIGNPQKVAAWECLAKARQELENSKLQTPDSKLELAWKQMYICEGSDWFWWYGEEFNGDFDRLFRMHLSNFYTIIGKNIPEYLKRPII
jgi:alpha-amylase/alpha-mannosidase (GH57 family)